MQMQSLTWPLASKIVTTYLNPLKHIAENSIRTDLERIYDFKPNANYYKVIAPKGLNVFIPVLGDDLNRGGVIKYCYLVDIDPNGTSNISRQVSTLATLNDSKEKIRMYLSKLNNVSLHSADIYYALPNHINHLVGKNTPATFHEEDLRDPEMFSLLNELPIRLLLLS